MVTKFNSGQGVNLSAEMNTSPGRIDVSGTVSGKLGIGVADTLGGYSRDTIDIRFDLKTDQNFREELSSHFSNIRSQLSNVPSGIPSSYNDALPSDLTNISSESGNLWIGVFGNHISGKEEVEFSKSINFEPIKIPSIASNSIDLDNIPSPKLEVQVIPKEAIQRVLGGVTGSNPSVEFEIPVSVLFEEVSLDQYGCAELFSDLDSTVDELKTRSNEISSGLRSESDVLSGIVNDIAGDTYISPTGIQSGEDATEPTQIQSSLSDVTVEDLSDIDMSQLQEWKTKVQNTSPGSYDISDVQSRIEDAIEQAESIPSGNCAQNFKSELETARGRMEGLQSIQSSAESMRSNLLDILSGVDSIDCSQMYGGVDDRISEIEERANIGTFGGSFRSSIDASLADEILGDVDSVMSQVESQVDSGSACSEQFKSRLDTIRSKAEEASQGGQGQLDCGDIPQEYRNAVASLEAAAQNFAARDILARTEERKGSLQDEAESVISRLEENVDDSNPCKRQLISRARDAMSNIKSSGVRPETALPCSERFSDTADELDEFEDTVLSLSAPITPETVQEVSQRGEEVINSIENNVPSDDPCRREMTERSRSLVSRVEKLTTQIRISEFDESEVNQEREQLMQQLFDSIERVSPGDGEVTDPGDVVDGGGSLPDIPDT